VGLDPSRDCPGRPEFPLATETERYASETVPPAVRAPDPKIGLHCGIWIAFVLGAGTGAAMVFRFKALEMLGAAVFLILLDPHPSD
jgi:hypothetical protein